MAAAFKPNDNADFLRWLDRIQREWKPTQADLLEIGNHQKTRIIERTDRGVDYLGNPFARYNSTRPYYYYPRGRGGAKLNKSELTKLRRFAEKYGATTAADDIGLRERAEAAKRAQKQLGGKRTILGIRFESYEAFKFQGLGRTAVDLTGPDAPHMMGTIVVRTEGGEDAREVVIGIYDPEKGEIAEAHNEGLGNLPQRRFFDVSDADINEEVERIANRILARVTRDF